MPAADVGDLGPALELLHHAVQRGQPFLHQMVLIACPEEARSAAEQAFAAPVPADALAGLEGIRNLRLIQKCRRDHVAERAEEHRAVLVGKRHDLLGLHREFAARRIIVDVAGCGLGREPLADITFRGAGRLRKLS